MSPLSFQPEPAVSMESPSAWNGGSWLGCGNFPAMEAVFYLGAGWPQWKPLDTPGTHLLFKQGSLLTIPYSNTINLNNCFSYHGPNIFGADGKVSLW